MKIALDSCPLENTPGLLLPANKPIDNCPLTISPWKLPRRKIAFCLICRQIVPRKTAPPPPTSPRKIAPMINYTRDIFPQESEIFVL